MRFVDVKNDVAFRKIFGNEKKTEILISFLNAILKLPKGKRIQTVKILNPYQFPKVNRLKSSILDVRVTDERDISYIVEMQVEEPKGFDKRVQYYTAKEYSAQIEKGEDYPLLNQVIFIGILDFNFFTDDTHYITRHRTLNIKTRKSTLDGMEYNFIELPKFNKKLEEATSLVDKWIYFIKNASTLDVIPDNVTDKGLMQAYENAETHSWTKKELHDYDYASMRKQDEKGVTQLAEEKAFGKGIEQGKQNEKIDIAIEMIKDGESIERIIKYTKLSREIIKNLIK